MSLGEEGGAAVSVLTSSPGEPDACPGVTNTVLRGLLTQGTEVGVRETAARG